MRRPRAMLLGRLLADPELLCTPTAAAPNSLLERLPCLEALAQDAERDSWDV